MILNIYKEKNWTSFDVVAKLRGMLKTKKIGHAGTLDPLAEGVLVVLTDKDTKKQDTFMQLKKEYIAEIAFGCESETYDLELSPTLVSQNLDLQITKESLLKTFPKYIKTFEQTAPLYSAKKVNGKVLYKEARKGNFDVELPKKTVTIYDLQILDSFEKQIETTEGVYKFPVFKVRVTCSSGTYIRSLAHDLGKDLETEAVLTDRKSVV